MIYNDITDDYYFNVCVVYHKFTAIFLQSDMMSKHVDNFVAIFSVIKTFNWKIFMI